MKEETQLRLAENSRKYNRLYVLTGWAGIIFMLLFFGFLGFIVKELSGPTIRPELLGGWLLAFVLFLIMSLGLWRLAERRSKKIKRDRKAILGHK